MWIKISVSYYHVSQSFFLTQASWWYCKSISFPQFLDCSKQNDKKIQIGKIQLLGKILIGAR